MVRLDRPCAARQHVSVSTHARSERCPSPSPKQLLAPSGNWYLGSSAIAVDASGRAQLLFIVGRNKNNAQLYYAASPAV
jgi:hypothetical protein